MNKVRIIKLAVLLICFFNLNAYGQQRREIPKQEFFDAYRKAVDKTHTLAYRIVSKNEMFRGDEIKSLENGTTEFVPPDRTHFISELKELTINKTFRNESFRIGNDYYTRANDGEWKKQIKNAATASAANKSHTKPIERNPQFFLTENVLFNGQAAKLYELSVEHVFTKKTSDNQNKESIAHWKEKRWISGDGKFLQMELETEWREETPKKGNRRVSIYEYDPNIKIEAPKMIEQEKK